jgi:hypothetical protein
LELACLESGLIGLRPAGVTHEVGHPLERLVQDELLLAVLLVVVAVGIRGEVRDGGDDGYMAPTTTSMCMTVKWPSPSS